MVMKRFIFQSIITIAGILLSISALCAQPSILFDTEKHNFGVSSDLYLEHTFIFSNVGTEDLVIGDVVPS